MGSLVVRQPTNVIKVRCLPYYHRRPLATAPKRASAERSA